MSRLINMGVSITKWQVIFICAVYARSIDDIFAELDNSKMTEMFQATKNQTNPEKLLLPANATSIRRNISDNFSCENRTYGYYADVDNECQVYHVCLPSQIPSGRKVTYRWSFICPNETIFNQAVLVCARPIDSIYCEESPEYYDLNNDIGKVNTGNNTNEQKTFETNINKNMAKKLKNTSNIGKTQFIHQRESQSNDIDNLMYRNIVQNILKDDFKSNSFETVLDMKNIKFDEKKNVNDKMIYSDTITDIPLKKI